MNTFSETQKFNQWWIWLILIGASILPVAIAISEANKGTFGNSAIAGMVVSAIVPSLLIAVFRVFRLSTKITEDGVSYQFFPIQLKPKLVSWNDIDKAYVRQYRPIAEYGGWGMRFTFQNGNALNIAGNMGLQIIFKNGKKTLIGTQKPDEMNDILNWLANQGIIDKNVNINPGI